MQIMKILLFILTLCVGLNANDLLNNLSEYDKKRVIIAVANCFRENPHIRQEVLEVERGIKKRPNYANSTHLKIRWTLWGMIWVCIVVNIKMAYCWSWCA